MKTAKPFWRSKTLIFNAAAVVLATVEANANLIQPYVPGNVYAWGFMLVTCGNAVLRLITARGVSLK